MEKVISPTGESFKTLPDATMSSNDESKLQSDKNLETHHSNTEESLDSEGSEADESLNSGEATCRPAERADRRPRKKVQRLVECLNKSFEQKQAQRSKQSEAMTCVQHGEGTPLGEIPSIEASIRKTKPVDLKILHLAAFSRPGSVNEIRSNLRKFCGFPFDNNSQEFAKRVHSINNRSAVEVRAALRLLHLEVSGSRQQMASRLLDFLAAPTPSAVKCGGKLPTKSARGRKPKTSSKLQPGGGRQSLKRGPSPRSETSLEAGSSEMPSSPSWKAPASKRRKLRQPSLMPTTPTTNEAAPAGPTKEEDVAAWALVRREGEEALETTEAADDVAETKQKRGLQAVLQTKAQTGQKRGRKRKSLPSQSSELTQEEEDEAEEVNKKRSAPLAKAAKERRKRKKRDPVESSETHEEDEGSRKKRATPVKRLTIEGSSDDEMPLVKMIPKKEFPSDDQLKSHVIDLLKAADLHEISMKSVRDTISAQYSLFDLSAKKQYINNAIKEYLSSSSV